VDKELRKKKILNLPRLYFETIRGLGAEQIFHQIMHRLGPLPFPAPRIDASKLRMRLPAPRCERARMQATPKVLGGEFTAWGVTRRLDLRRPWEAPDLGRSWIYPLHYFDGVPALALSTRDAPGGPEAIVAFMEQWIAAHPPGRGVAWDPYPTALRLVNWADVLEILGDRVSDAARARIAASVWTQAAWLNRRLEQHLQGTHLLKDLKAMLLAASMFDDARAQRWGRRAEALWRRQIAAQVLGDGSHVECSVMYHGLALSDVLDVLNWRLGSESLRAETAAIAQRMLDYLAAVQTPAGEYPLFGDASYDAVPSPRALLVYAGRLGFVVRTPPSGWQLHADAGFAVWRDARQYLIAKVGGIGPKQVAAHAHCDAQSYEWHAEGRPIVVDSGVRSYEVGAERFASRCTQAHNTVCIDAREQHEIWAAFRIGRRSRVSFAVEDDAVESRLVPWFDRNLTVVRRFQCGATGIHIQDQVEGSGTHTIESRIHLHPDCKVRPLPEIRIEHSGVRAVIHRSTGGINRVSFPASNQSVYCEQLGVQRPNYEALMVRHEPLPYAAETWLTLEE